MESKIKYWVKHVLAAFHIRRESLRPILLFSTRRSGSTLLMETIYSQQGMTYCDQPLDLWRYHPYQKQLPSAYLSQFIHLTVDEEEAFKHFFEALLTGKIRVHSPWNLLDSKYSFVVNRLVVKILSAHALIDWFADNFEVSVVYLVRHPIPTALSIIRKGWGCVAAAFLQNKHFYETYLDDMQIKECALILERGTPLQKSVLEWGLANLYPLSVYHERSWCTLTYEEFIMRPQALCQLLATQLELTDPVRMVEQTLKPSKTTDTQAKEAIHQKNPSDLLRRWSNQVTPAEAGEAMQLINELLDIDVYRWDSPFPAAPLCHFGALDA